MKRIFVTLLTILIVGFFTSCKNANQKQETVKKEEYYLDKPFIVISQDTYDRDNFSLIYIANKMKELKKINLISIDVTGVDSGNKGGLLFSVASESKFSEILINHNIIGGTRATPSSQIYGRIYEYPNDGLLDSQRKDSTLGLYEALISLPQGKKAIYVVGGHLSNLESLLRNYPEIVKEKISTVVLSVGWKDRKSGRPEMNLSQGLWKPNPVGDSSNYVLRHLPNSVRVVVASDPDAPYPKINNSVIKSEALRYLIENGHYKENGVFYMGDFEALLYAVSGVNWYGNIWANEVKTCLKTNKFGGLYVSGGNCNHYYLDNVNIRIVKPIFEEFMNL